MLRIENISGGYNKEPIVQSVSFHVNQGEMLGILGPNGSGKSTLLKLISGILPLQSGSVKIAGKDISYFTQKELAKKMAVLPQLHTHSFSHSVYETVSLGRYPYQSGLFSTWSETDKAAVEEAMASTATTQFKDQSIELLSGGEKQRVFVAQALAQEAPILLLDEPTNHLDIAHQQQLLDTIRKQAVEKGLTVLSVFHDINLASLYCDRLILMNNGQIEKIGAPHEVIMEDSIQTVYEARVKAQPHPEQPKPQLTLLPHLSKEKKLAKVTENHFLISSKCVALQVDSPLKVLSSAVHNPGFGWYHTFINRHVDKDYACDDVKSEMANYLAQQGFSLNETVAMMTAVKTEHVVIEHYESLTGSIVIAVTAGVGNAVDVSKAQIREEKSTIGTINTWVIVNGYLSDEAFIQAMITATEAKSKALQTENVEDPLTKTVATGTSTDSLLVAATQQGNDHPYAGPITEIGKLIGFGVYECTIRAIQSYKREKGWTT